MKKCMKSLMLWYSKLSLVAIPWIGMIGLAGIAYLWEGEIPNYSIETVIFCGVLLVVGLTSGLSH